MSRLTLRPEPPDGRTKGKDHCAAWIQKFVVEANADLPKLQIAKGSGWSRQHVTNVLEEYFIEGESPTRPEWLTGPFTTNEGYSRQWEELEDRRQPGNQEFESEFKEMEGLDVEVSIPVKEIIKLEREAYRQGMQDSQEMKG